MTSPRICSARAPSAGTVVATSRASFELTVPASPRRRARSSAPRTIRRRPRDGSALTAALHRHAILGRYPTRGVQMIRKLALLLAAAALLVPIAAGAKTRATTVAVTAGKPGEFHFKLAKSAAKKGAVTFKV